MIMIVMEVGSTGAKSNRLPKDRSTGKDGAIYIPGPKEL